MRTKIVLRLLIIEHAFQELVLYRGLALGGKRNKFREDIDGAKNCYRRWREWRRKMHTIRQKVAGEHYSIQTFELSRLCRQFSVQNQFSLVTKNLFGGQGTLRSSTNKDTKNTKSFTWPSEHYFASLVHGYNRAVLIDWCIIMYKRLFVSVIPTHPYLELTNDNCQNIREFCENHVSSFSTVNW